MTSCIVAACSHASGSISAHYLLNYRLENGDGALRLTVSVNVEKAVIVFFLPLRTEIGAQEILKLMAPTMRGARHEGYVFDEELVETTRESQRYLLLIARRGLPRDFLWNPAAKLHYAWDKRAFAYSVIHDGNSLLAS